MKHVLFDHHEFWLPDLPATCADPRAPRRGEPPTPGPDLPPGQ